MKREPDKTYKHKGYNIKVYYGTKSHEQAIRELFEMQTNEFIRKLSKNI